MLSRFSSVPTLCNPMDYSPPGSSVHGILPARILEWVGMPNPGNEVGSPALQADSLPSEPPGKPKLAILSQGGKNSGRTQSPTPGCS